MNFRGYINVGVLGLDRSIVAVVFVGELLYYVKFVFLFIGLVFFIKGCFNDFIRLCF